MRRSLSSPLIRFEPVAPAYRRSWLFSINRSLSLTIWRRKDRSLCLAVSFQFSPSNLTWRSNPFEQALLRLNGDSLGRSGSGRNCRPKLNRNGAHAVRDEAHFGIHRSWRPRSGMWETICMAEKRTKADKAQRQADLLDKKSSHRPPQNQGKKPREDFNQAAVRIVEEAAVKIKP